MSGYGPSRFDEMASFGSRYSTPGWQRAQARKGKGGFDETGQRRYVPDGEEFDDGDDLSSPPPGGGRSAAAGRREGVSGRTLHSASRRTPLTIEGELVAKSTGAPARFAVGDRVFHQKFGNGNVTVVDGNKLTIRFDKAGEKRVVDSFVERV
jgi:DNA helicase-2/ATP-dependent DNA helicase PcrA